MRKHDLHASATMSHTMHCRIVRLGLLVLSVFVCCSVMACVAHAGQTADNARATPAESHPETILIFPFENESRMPTLDWLGEGFSELTAERFEDRGVNVLSREERLATLERMGLPDSARFSHATIVKIAAEADADAVVYGRFQSDGKTITVDARVLHLSPPSLSAQMTETSN